MHTVFIAYREWEGVDPNIRRCIGKRFSGIRPENKRFSKVEILKLSRWEHKAPRPQSTNREGWCNKVTGMARIRTTVFFRVR